MKNSDFNFQIQSPGKISSLFLEKGISDFSAASEFVRQLPYRRNTDKNDPTIIFREDCGTCGTKHATLALLVEENKIPGVKLIMGIYRMKPENTPGIADSLEASGLSYVPEAHNYLRIEGEIFDCTGINPDTGFTEDLLEEIEIRPDQISDHKVKLHRAFLEKWIGENAIPFSLEEIWKIRENCIHSIALKMN